jgi:hypothetical protein
MTLTNAILSSPHDAFSVACSPTPSQKRAHQPGISGAVTRRHRGALTAAGWTGGCAAQERTVEARHGLPETVPFYLNGWRAYSSHSELFDDAPPPYFTEAVDHTRLILQQVQVPQALWVSLTPARMTVAFARAALTPKPTTADRTLCRWTWPCSRARRLQTRRVSRGGTASIRTSPSSLWGPPAPSRASTSTAARRTRGSGRCAVTGAIRSRSSVRFVLARLNQV